MSDRPLDWQPQGSKIRFLAMVRGSQFHNQRQGGWTFAPWGKWLSGFIIYLLVLVSLVVAPPANADYDPSKPQLKFNDIISEAPFRAPEILMQSRDRHVWIGTQQGLFRFDGIDFKHYAYSQNPNALLHPNVPSLFEDRQGFIWIGYNNAGLSRLDPRTDNFVHFTTGSIEGLRISSNYVRAFAEDRDGRIWIATDAGLSMFDPETGLMEVEPISGADRLNIFSLSLDVNGHLWIGADQGLFVSSRAVTGPNHTSHAINMVQKMANTQVRSLLLSGKKMWVGTNAKGIYQLDLSAFDNTAKLMFSGSHEWAFSSVRDITQDPGGNIWFATNEGLALYTASEGNFYLYQNNTAQPSSVAGNSVLDVLVGDQQQVWIVLSDRVQKTRLMTAAFKSFGVDQSNENSLNEKAVRMVAMDRGQNLWLATIKGLYQQERGQAKFIQHLHDEQSIFQFQTPGLKSFLEDSQGRIWIGTLDFGVAVIDAERKKKSWFAHDPEEQHSFKGGRRNNFIFEDRDQQIWIGNDTGVHRFIEATGDFRAYLNENSDGVPMNQHALSISQTDDGHIFVGTRTGQIFILPPEENTFQKVTIQSVEGKPLPLSGVTGVKMRGETVWVSDYGIGLLRATLSRRPDFSYMLIGQVYDNQNGLSDQSVNSLYFDLHDENTIWINTDTTISRFEISEERFFNYTEVDGILSATDWQLCNLQAPSGVIYYCGSGGIQFFLPQEVRIDRESPPISLTEFYLDFMRVRISTHENPTPLTQTIGYAKEITLNYDQNEFGFDFAALDLIAPDKNKYAYILEGYSGDWVHVDAKRRHANFGNVPHGTYKFRVKASNHHGFWNEEGASVVITVLPPWYLTLWAKAMWFVLGLLVINAFVRLRTRQLKLRSVELRQAVDDRTEELKVSNLELASTLEKLEEMSMTDQLTGAHNRHFLNKFMTPELARFRRDYTGEASQGIGFLLIDIDHFKKVNDTHGHDAGDAVLVDFTVVLRSCCRVSDWIVRWGGEEFVVVARGQDLVKLETLAERIRDSIAKHSFTLPGGQVLSQSCSIGIASWPFISNEPDALTWEQTLGIADQALYKAKHDGRNRWVSVRVGNTKNVGDLYACATANFEEAIQNGDLVCSSGR